MTRLKAKAEFCLHKMGYQPYKNGRLWKKTFGFSLIVAEFTTDKIVFRGYSNSNGETFSYKAVSTLLADFMPVKDVREEIAHAECNLGIDSPPHANTWIGDITIRKNWIYMNYAGLKN